MRDLLRSLLTLFTLGVTVTGCNRPNTPGPSGDSDATFHAVFRVPGMT